MEEIGLLESIPIDTEPFIDNRDDSGTLAILREIDVLLELLVTRDEEGVIDTKARPLTHDEYLQLQYILGRGELSATIQSLGRSTVYETAITGVWWLTHYDDEGEVMADLIEITTIPKILKSDRSNIQSALSELRVRIKREQPLIV